MTHSASDPNQQALPPIRTDTCPVALQWVRPAAVIILSLLVANCASNPTTKTASGNKYGVKASPKVIADGEPIPKGGGYDMVGKPYTVGGKLYVPREDKNYSATGTASWYGPSFHGRMTANGEVFDRESVSVAHPTLPLPSYVRVTNTLNGRSIIARVNDRGPYHDDRLVDVSEQVANSLNFKHLGTARVRVDYVGRAPIEGDDDKVLLATLRTDGRPAQLGRQQPSAQIASTAPFVPQQVSEPPKTLASPQAKADAAKAEPTKAPSSTMPLAKPPVAAQLPVQKFSVQAPAKPAVSAAKTQPVAAKAQTGKAGAAPQTAAKLPSTNSAPVKTAALMAKPAPVKAEPAKSVTSKTAPVAKATDSKASSDKSPVAAQSKKPPVKPHPQTASDQTIRKSERG